MKHLIVHLAVTLCVVGAKAQVQDQIPILPKKDSRVTIFELDSPISLFGSEDPEQEAELEEAARVEANGSVQTKREAKPGSSPLDSFYNKNTLLIPTPRSEIQKNNTWKSHGVAYDKFMGVTAYANKRNGKFQCTEVTHRFLNDVFGVPTKVGNGMGHANVLTQNFAKTFGNDTFKYKDQNIKMTLRQNGNSAEPPAVGSPINFQSGKFGHIAIVRFVEVIDNNTVRVHLFEQHGFPKHKIGAKKEIRSIDFTKSANGKWSGERVLGIGQVLYWINFTTL